MLIVLVFRFTIAQSNISFNAIKKEKVFHSLESWIISNFSCFSFLLSFTQTPIQSFPKKIYFFSRLNWFASFYVIRQLFIHETRPRKRKSSTVNQTDIAFGFLTLCIVTNEIPNKKCFANSKYGRIQDKEMDDGMRANFLFFVILRSKFLTKDLHFEFIRPATLEFEMNEKRKYLEEKQNDVQSKVMSICSSDIYKLIHNLG